MAQPAYLLHKGRFDSLRKDRGYDTLQQFADQNYLKIRTLQDLRAGKKDTSLSTVRAILDAFPGVPFEYLFRPTVDASRATDEYADLRVVA